MHDYTQRRDQAIDSIHPKSLSRLEQSINFVDLKDVFRTIFVDTGYSIQMTELLWCHRYEVLHLKEVELFTHLTSAVNGDGSKCCGVTLGSI